MLTPVIATAPAPLLTAPVGWGEALGANSSGGAGPVGNVGNMEQTG